MDDSAESDDLQDQLDEALLERDYWRAEAERASHRWCLCERTIGRAGAMLACCVQAEYIAHQFHDTFGDNDPDDDTPTPWSDMPKEYRTQMILTAASALTDLKVEVPEA